MSFADARRKKGLSQKVVAEKMGVDQSTVCLWECRKTMPRAGILLKLAALYGCTVDDLLRQEDRKENA